MTYGYFLSGLAGRTDAIVSGLGVLCLGVHLLTSVVLRRNPKTSRPRRQGVPVRTAG